MRTCVVYLALRICSMSYFGRKKEKKPPPPPPPQLDEPFDPFVQKVINSVHSKIVAATGIEREEFKGLRFCQYVVEEVAYFVKLHQEGDKFMHVKIAKPFVPSLQYNWDVPYEVTEVKKDKKNEDKIRVWSKEHNCQDRRRRDDFYQEDTWDPVNEELGLVRPKIDFYKYEKMAALTPD